MRISENGLKIIRAHEGYRSKPYLDNKYGRVPTIGYGNTTYADGRKVTMQDKPITKEQAEELLVYKVNTVFGPAVDKLVVPEIGQNMFDALVSFTYNVGVGNFTSSTLLKKLNALDFKGAEKEFHRWNKDEGVVLQGLVERRKQEAALFAKDILPGGCM